MQNFAKHRRETAEKELGSTRIRRNVSVITLIIFALTVLSVPFCQFIIALHRGETPPVFHIANLLPVPSREAIQTYEDTLEEKSVLTDWLLPGVQTVLTRLLRIGNEQVYLGREGWLFYRADIDSLSGKRHHQENTRFQARQQTAHAAQADNSHNAALTAIINFNRQLEMYDIKLIVLPTPVKPTIHPEKFSARYRDAKAPLHSPACTAFVEALLSNDILVYQPSTHLFEAARSVDQYLKTDTHWRPEAMERVAKHFAEFIAAHVQFSTAPTPGYTYTAIELANIGDIAKMLKLPTHQTLFPPEHITCRVIRTDSGELWQPTREAEILFLGDSFSNIYSLADMGWGESAGFVEHLSAALSRPIDKIVINAGGALATRQALMQELNRGDNRLAGKRVLVYQFATRELSDGDWKLLPLPTPNQNINAATPKTQYEEITVTATIKAKTMPPAPRSVPYSECIIALHLENVKTPQLPNELVVFLWGMRQNRWTAATAFKVGQQVKLDLRPWVSVESDYDSYYRKELEDEQTWLLDIYWGEIP